MGVDDTRREPTGTTFVAPPIELTAEVITPDESEKTNYTLKELLALEDTGEQCLFAPIFTKSGIAVLVGGSDTGKSSFLRQMAMAVCAGRDFMGWQYGGEHNKAIYFSSEDDEKITSRVVKKYNRSLQLSPEVAENLRFEFEINPDELPGKLEAMLMESPADLVIIDAMGDAFNGKSLNDNQEVRKFYNHYKAIARRFDCLIIFNHHTGKRTGAYAPSKDNTLGSQAIEAAPRLAMELRTDPSDPELKHLCVTKCNYLASGSEYKTKSFAMKMDDNAVFEPTGDNKEFSDLATDERKQEKRPKNPRKIDDETHKDFIISIFSKTESGKMTLTEIRENVEIEFETSTTTAKTFLTHYKNNGWIEFAERGQRRTEYYKTTLAE